MASILVLSPEVRDEVVRLFDKGRSLMEALLHVRRSTGAGLAEAHAAVQSVLREEGRLRVSSSSGTSAELIAVGPFSPDIAPFLDYDRALYEGVPAGAKVVAHLLDVYENDKEAHALASSLGADVWDFNTHALDPWRADLDALRLLTEGDEEWVHRFVSLRAAGFRFFFRVSPP
jgi:hypothetical protein